jgi:hypothetical protein
VFLLAFWLFPATAAQAVAPTVTSFAPTRGVVGTSVVVTGTDFTGATDVTFDGVAATFTVDSNTQITTTVPVGATTGPIAVTTIDGTGTSASNFVVIVPPVINDFSPKSGTFRRIVTITGSGFTGTTSVRFNGRRAPFAVLSDGQIRARVPSGAGTGPIRVTNAAGSDVSNTIFRFLRFQHRVVVAMQLSGHLRAVGSVNVPDRTRLCRAHRAVIIQRFFSGRFRVVARGRSQLDGDYRISVRDKTGRYRALVGQKLTPNHRCLPDVSFIRTHRHPPPPDGGGGGGGATCTPGYSPCLPVGPSDYDCFGGGGNGPAYTKPGVTYRVTGSDPYGLDGDNDGFGCE